MELDAELPDEEAFQSAADEVADENDPEGQIDRHAERDAAGAEPVPPGPVPEGRMDEVDPVIEDIAPFRRGQGHARELAVDRVEERHQPGGDEPGREHALGEEPQGEQHEDEADEGDAVGADATLRGPARHHHRRRGPEPFGHEIGDALVGAGEAQPLELDPRRRLHRSKIGLRPLAQRMVIA